MIEISHLIYIVLSLTHTEVISKVGIDSGWRVTALTLSQVLPQGSNTRGDVATREKGSERVREREREKEKERERV